MRSRFMLTTFLLLTAGSCKEREFVTGVENRGSTSLGEPTSPKQIVAAQNGAGSTTDSSKGGSPPATPTPSAEQGSSGGGHTSVNPTPTPVMATSGGKDGVNQSPPTGMTNNGGKPTAPPDYQTCAGLPTVGKKRYPAKCDANQVMAVINDGKAQEMTCCPLVGKDILSADPAEQYLKRTGRCGADEVGVGMEAAANSVIYCSKINYRYLKLTTPIKSIYVTAGSALNPTMKAIAASYNIRDTCICPEKSILIGGHTTKDNVCTDICVEIVLK